MDFSYKHAMAKADQHTYRMLAVNTCYWFQCKYRADDFTFIYRKREREKRKEKGTLCFFYTINTKDLLNRLMKRVKTHLNPGQIKIHFSIGRVTQILYISSEISRVKVPSSCLCLLMCHSLTAGFSFFFIFCYGHSSREQWIYYFPFIIHMVRGHKLGSFTKSINISCVQLASKTFSIIKVANEPPYCFLLK